MGIEAQYPMGVEAEEDGRKRKRSQNTQNVQNTPKTTMEWRRMCV